MRFDWCVCGGEELARPPERSYDSAMERGYGGDEGGYRGGGGHDFRAGDQHMSGYSRSMSTGSGVGTFHR